MSHNECPTLPAILKINFKMFFYNTKNKELT
jgi:hypothetical protein